MTDTEASFGTTSSLPGGTLLRSLVDNWWLLLLRGLVAIAFGVLAFVWPGITLLYLTLLWGAYALVDGILALWAAVAGKAATMSQRWWFALVGVIGVIAGVVTFVAPGVTAAVLLTFIAVWAILVGILQIVGAIGLRKEIEGEWLLALSGLISIAFGVSMVVQPQAGALAVIWLIGSFAIAAGVVHIFLATRLRTLGRRG